MPVTLAQAKVGMADHVDQQVIDNFRRGSQLLDALTFDNCVSPGTGGSTLTYGYTQLKTPATAAFRELNAEYTPKEADRNTKTVELKIFGGSFQVDRVLANTTNGQINEVDFQLKEKINATINLFHYMALGGGTFTVQNKALPGAYINFVSAARASATLSDRGTAAFPLALDWGPENEVFTVESVDFQKNSLKLFGHAYTDDALRPLREIFANAQTLHVFRLNTGGVKASCQYAEAKYPGTVGNDLKIVIAQNEAFEETENKVYDVSTYVGATQVDVQKAVKSVSDLTANDYVTWKGEEALSVSAGIALTGGTNGTVQDAAYQTYLDKIEPYSFNVMGCDSTNDTIKALFANFTKRMRDEQGVKFQTVLHRYTKADYEGVISVENGLAGADTDPSLVYWVTGAEAACAVNKSLTNAVYTGEYAPYVDYTQTQLEKAITAGKLMLHRVGSEARVLTDISTFVSVIDEKSADFSSNQVIRVLDQIANDIASLFNTKYLGKVQNDAAGRVSLWSDIVQHHNQLQTIRAIENFNSEQVTVMQGDLRKSVAVADYVQPVSAMEQLYMVVTVQ